jgi:hypothetical protein
VNTSQTWDNPPQSWDTASIPTESSPGPLPILGLFGFYARYKKLKNRR